MQFGVALKRLKVGEAMKTLGMAGFIYKGDSDIIEKDKYPYSIKFKNKDGLERVFYMTEEGVFRMGVFESNNVQVLSGELLNQIAFGDWNISTIDEAENSRQNFSIYAW